MSRRETNPHFSRPPRPQPEDYQQPPIPIVPPKKHRGKQSKHGGATPPQEEDASHRPRYPMQMPPAEYDDRVPLRTHQDHHSPLQPVQPEHDHNQPSILQETNPHFPRLPRHQPEDYRQPPIAIVPPKKHRGKQSKHGGATPPREEVASHRPRYPMPMQMPPAEYDDRVPLRTHQDHHSPLQPEHEHNQPSILRAPLHDQSQRGTSHKQPQDQGLRSGKSRVNFQEPSTTADGPPVVPPPNIHPEFRQPRTPRRLGGGIQLPKEQKSQPITWMGACLCVIFWLVIIIGGLIVLIVYLVFRPQIPHFDVSGATLNAAYIDYGYLLNADITLLANFTNPNKKVHVDFSSVTINLHYGNTLIATQYVEPFSAAKVQSRFAYIHMVTSQVQLPTREAQRLVKQMESNGVLLDVKGVFRARSKLGAILRYSYNLYGHCNIMVTRPPGGILLKKKCITKR